ncbi:alpha/beta hydrolase [Dokdonella koreensis]|uniref:Alpha/beta family hydrolase n=1 Tax=Dokdonella koreensis DS-123 TaxID=1300342 RepID=A0A167G6N2_9GAMM|nr:alpha/beta fold hydrolase [Dokdonella koreensis]ANB16212.1 Alpha/beta family hydrolase [Dokdonella koreensis DS-123]
MSTSPAPAPASFPDAASDLLLPGPVGPIELACALPEPDVARAGTAVICHPHPLQGGTMHNKVVTILERALRELGLATVRFNFRGVGASAGTFDEGNGESDDLAAIVDWVRRVRPSDAVWLAGFSFGSYVALRNARRLDAAALVTVAPPVGRWDFDPIELPACPWLVVQGEEDEVVDPAAVFAWIETLKQPPHLVRMPETGHFFHRRLMDLRGLLKNALQPHLPPPA